MEQNKIKRVNPTEIKFIYKKYQKLMRQKEELADFKEPIVMLERRDGGVDFYEDAKQGEWEYEHSEGEYRIITLHPKFLKKFRYGKGFFKGYYCHEDYPFPLTADILCPIDTFTVAIEKALNDMRKWKAQEWEARGNFWWKVAGGIALLIGVYILYKMLIPSNTTIEHKVTETIIQNVTPTIIR